MYKERNKTSDAGGGTRFFRQVAFVMLFLMLAGSLAGIGSLLFKNTSVLDEAGRGTVDVEVATIYGAGTSDNPFLIGTKADLEAMRNAVNTANGTLTGQIGGGSLGGGTATAATAHYKLTADIDFGKGNTTNWTPIGTSNTLPFKGTFDGAQHVIKNLYIRASGGYQGFFGYLENGSVVKNLGMVDSDLETTGTGTAGAIGGITGTINLAVTISDCFNAGKVTGAGSTGGIVGWVGSCAGSKIINCFNVGTIKSTGHSVGGFYGHASSAGSDGTIGALMKNCFNAGQIIGTGGQDVAGLGADSVHKYEDCYNTGNLSGSTGSVGGIRGAGHNYWTVNRTYNTGTTKDGIDSSASSNWNKVSNSYNLTAKSSVSDGGGIPLVQADMYADTTLINLMAGLGTENWYKRPNESDTVQTKMYYPELKVFAEHEWVALRAYSKASVTVAGPQTVNYDEANINNEKPICNSNTTVEVPSIGNGT